VDTPAASLGADGAVIAAKCGAAVVMARRDKSSVISLQNIVHTAAIGNTNVVGSIINEF
jgi:protein-tyrosine kinase